MCTPGKRLFFAIIADYNLNRLICELIDNALDNWISYGKANLLQIIIEIDIEQQTLIIKDNSGGVKECDLKNLISPGETGNDPCSEIIGYFGVGTKRSVIALAKDVKIKSRHKKQGTFLVEFNDDWLLENNNWSLEYYLIDDIEESNTHIILQSIRYVIDEKMVDRLKEHLKATYAKFLVQGNFKILVNGEYLTPILFENWAYPPDYKPIIYKGIVSTDEGDIRVKILAGLSKESSPATGEYGVYFYCNNRLIARGLRTIPVGFGTHLAGKPHPDLSIMRVIVTLDGSAKLMPWNSSKSDIYYEHKIFEKIQDNLIKIVMHFAKISRSLQGTWSDTVFQFKEGTISEHELDFRPGGRLHLPPTPLSKPRFSDSITIKNKVILDQKPWTKGLIGGIIATDFIFKKDFDEKNRISIIILDSTLEIAFKEFLVNESGVHYSDSQLSNIFSKRHLVESEIKKYIYASKISNNDWRKIKYYYDIRCKLVHQRAAVGITDEQVKDYRKLIEKILKKMFNLKFEKQKRN